MISIIRVAIIMMFLYNRTMTNMEVDAKNWSLSVIGVIMFLMKEYGLWDCGLEKEFKGLRAPT